MFGPVMGVEGWGRRDLVLLRQDQCRPVGQSPATTPCPEGRKNKIANRANVGSIYLATTTTVSFEIVGRQERPIDDNWSFEITESKDVDAPLILGTSPVDDLLGWTLEDTTVE